MTDSASQSLVDRGWTPEQFWEYLEAFVGDWETKTIRTMMADHGLSLVPAARITELEAERDRLRKYCSAAAHDYGSLLTTLESSIGPPFLESFKETRNELRESSEFMRLAAEGRENGLLYDDELSAAKQRALAAEPELSRVEVETIERCAAIALDNRQHSNQLNYRDDSNGYAEMAYEQACNDVAESIRSLPPLAKRGEQKETHCTKPESTQNI
jgi:hypothetical protein